MNHEALTQKKQQLDKLRPLPPALVRNLDSGNLLKIGALAKAAGETAPTIRYWTQ